MELRAKTIDTIPLPKFNIGEESSRSKIQLGLDAQPITFNEQEITKPHS